MVKRDPNSVGCGATKIVVKNQIRHLVKLNRKVVRMKAFSFLVSFMAVFLVSTAAVADDFAVALGYRSNTADTDSAVTSTSIGTKAGLALGVMGLFDLTDKFQVRSGFVYTQRNYTSTFASVDTDINLSYIDIPVTGVYRFADYAGFFAGPVLSLLASKEIKNSAGTATFTKSPETLNFGLQFGATFKFAPQMGAEIFYEMIPGAFAPSHLKAAKTVGLNFLVTFE